MFSLPSSLAVKDDVGRQIKFRFSFNNKKMTTGYICLQRNMDFYIIVYRLYLYKQTKIILRLSVNSF
jgi:hypothetical protein